MVGGKIPHLQKSADPLGSRRVRTIVVRVRGSSRDQKTGQGFITPVHPGPRRSTPVHPGPPRWTPVDPDLVFFTELM